MRGISGESERGARSSRHAPLLQKKELLVTEPKDQPATEYQVILPQSEEMRVHIVRVQANCNARADFDVHAAAGNLAKLER